MKTTKKLDIVSIILVFCVFCLASGSLIACKEAGLGAAVDMTGPTLEISSPDYMDNVRSSLTVAGYAQDAESGIQEISVILTQRHREWRAINGMWQVRENPQAPWTNVPASEMTFWKQGDANRVDWSLEMDLTGLPEGQYTIKASARDDFYNSEAQSSQSRVVMYDNTPPVITVLSPALTTAGDDPENNPFEKVKDALDGKLPRNAAYLSELLNGGFEFRWQITDDVSVKDIEIQFAGKDGVVYYESTQYDIPRNGSVAIPKEEVYARETQAAEPPRRESTTDSAALSMERAPLMERTYLQVLTKSYDRADNYEWKRNGWVIWDPESDKPWTTPPQEFGESPETEAEVIAGVAGFLGEAYDDDGVASVTLSLYRGDDLESGYPITIEAEDAPVSFQWSFVPPGVEARYRLQSVAADKNGLSGDPQSAYFRTRIPGDPPEAVLQTPDSNDPLIGDQNGGIAFSGYVTDNSAIAHAYIAWMHPDNPATNRAFKNAGYEGWAQAKIAASYPYVDSASSSSKVWALPYGTPVDGGKGKKYDFSLSLNRWTDMAPGGAGNFSTQTFVIYVEDDIGSITVSEWTTGRDDAAPSVAIEKVQVNGGGWQTITENLLLPALNDSDTLTLQGEWLDDSVAVWQDTQKIKEFTVTWNGVEFPIASQTYNAGKVLWTSGAITADSRINAGSLKIKDSPMAHIRAEITDLAGNRTVADESFMVETDVPQLGRISSSNESGAYNQGKIITVTLEFNKSVTWNGANPSIVLTDTNNTALELAAAYTGGKGASKINFEYTVAPGVNTSGRLDVKRIDTPSQIVSNTKPALMNLPDQLNSLAGGKNIVIDTTAPTITSVNAVTSAGAYPKGHPLYFTVVTSESVAASGSPVLTFDNNQQSDAFLQTAGNTLLFSLTTVAGKDTAALRATGFSFGSGGVVTDDAGNQLVTQLPNTGMAGYPPTPVIIIDTVAPSAPAITGVFDNAMYFDRTQSFDISSLEAGRKKAEYTVDNGSTWNSYNGTPVPLTVNGTYRIKARQTDSAGNLSPESALYTVTVDAGKLLTKIDSPQNDGAYKENQTIHIDVYTRKAVAISDTSKPYIVLNIKNSGNDKKITGAIDVSGGTQWRFAYTIAPGDAFIGNESALRVAAISAGSASVTVSGVDVTADFETLTDIDQAMRLENQKKLRILTGKPGITSAVLKANSPVNNEYTGATLTLIFNRPVYKGTGNITLTQDAASYIPPAALTPTQYVKAGGDNALGSHYTEGVNGADSNYAPDLTSKYVLNYNKNPGDVKTIFIKADMHVAAISASSSVVAITNNGSANTGTVVITLSGSYAPPTFGASYEVAIPEGAFKDEFNTNSAAYNAPSLALDGVNKPVVRVQKERATLNNTSSPAVQPQQVSVKIDCQTPGATITHARSRQEDIVGMGIADNTPSDSPWINTFTGGDHAEIRMGLPDHSTSDPLNPSSPTAHYTGTLSLGDPDYNALKVKLIVKAAKNGAEAYAYESANKTVVEFRFSAKSGSDYNSGGGRDIATGEKLWIQGGDSPSGPSSIPGYPLSWENTKTGMNIMTGKNESDPAATTWYWVSWEISATTYIGFVAGDTDQESVNGKGPNSYSVAIEGWSSYKEAYALYPGEKRVLRSDRCARGGSVYINGQGRGVFGFAKTPTSNRP